MKEKREEKREKVGEKNRLVKDEWMEKFWAKFGCENKQRHLRLIH